MATMTVKSTYALDPETVRAIAELARRDGVSKSEALRRAVKVAAGRNLDALAALDELQASAALDADAVREWSVASRSERRASSARRERLRR